MSTVFLGLSGGVDSSVSALRLIDQGYDVVGVFMKNWTKDIPGFSCPWQQDYQDAKRIAVTLGLRFEVFDFEDKYQELVVDYMLDEYKRGRTPNPDIMCNQEVKFRLFLESAKKLGADMIATGHYARTESGRLYQSFDKKKDQTYFLYRAPKSALQMTLFPIGDISKAQVRRIASVHNLVTANKSESMGICFVGNIGIKDFLKQYVATEQGPIIDQNGLEVGQHEGAIFYTIGQRHGLQTGGGKPFYVTSKDMKTNTVYVSSNLDDGMLWTKSLNLIDCHFLSKPVASKKYTVRTRHLGELIEVTEITQTDQACVVVTKESVRAATPGQSAVLYSDEECIGGGIIA
jgi:tRNA-specific 2-thiouridylase